MHIMARKGNQLKNGLAQQHSISHKDVVVDHCSSPLTSKDTEILDGGDVSSREELPNGVRSVSSTEKVIGVEHVQDEKKNKKKSRKPQKKQKIDTDVTVPGQTVLEPPNVCTEVEESDISATGASNTRDGGDLPQNHNSDNMDNDDNAGNVLPGNIRLENTEFPETAAFKFLRIAALSMASASAHWVERHKPAFVALKSNIIQVRDHAQKKIQDALPLIVQWIVPIRNAMILLFMVWLDCTVRGIDSFLRMGTTSFFSILWCSVFSVFVMVGTSKFLLTLATAVAVGLFFGFMLATVLTGIAGIIFLWFYGSFWTTGLIILLGGLSFITAHDRIALLIMSASSIYCAWTYVGWFGLFLALNLSFISSDGLLFFLRNIINEERMPNGSSEQSPGFQGQPFFRPGESVHASPPENAAPGIGAVRGPGVPSTSGSDSEATPEDEIDRLLSCSDHYAALGLSRFQNIDALAIKKDYRKKAMLVHPDKNMGNEKAAEAFKKLQNAYEVLLDSFKCKEYDEELRREELLSYLRKLQNSAHENKRHGFFNSSSVRSEANGEDPLEESRRIACKKCGLFHLWFCTNKPKSKARWCQECKDFHPAKDGDGWVEQATQPFFFGILQQVEAPSAYACAEGKVYRVTEWYICQEMRCPSNAHKPTFHINTSVATKNTNVKGTSSGPRGGGIPAPNMEDTMTEEEFFEWLQHAVQNGMFENVGGSASERSSGFNPKSCGGSSGSSSSKRKKKGKKQC